MRLASRFLFAVIIGIVVAGCESNPALSNSATASPAISDPALNAQAEKAKPEISFVDFQGFDRELHTALVVPLPHVDIVFLDDVSPNAIPQRLQAWLATVESGGGQVKITPPKSDIVAKDPFLIFSMVNAVWHASNFVKESVVKAEHEPAKGFDAEIVLKKNENGNSVMDRIVFSKRSP